MSGPAWRVGAACDPQMSARGGSELAELGLGVPDLFRGSLVFAFVARFSVRPIDQTMKIPPFTITTTFNFGDRSSCLCEMSEPLDTQEFFDRLKLGFLQWRRSLSDSLHSLTVSAPIPRKDEAYRDLIQGLCDRWNSDPELAASGPTHVELALTHRHIDWIGCTTAKIVLYKMQSEQGDMYLVDYAQLHRDLEAQVRKAKAAEKARRRANPVEHPVALPANIKSEIARYLRLEYGESARDKDSLKARDLQFAGEFVIEGVPTQFWSYPSSNPKKPMWATVERFDDSYCLGMTDKRPPVA